MNRTILVVDDDHKTVELIRLYLQKEGYQILTAYDGREALDLARERAPDLLVLDLMLPSIDGLDVCKLLRAESKVPIIMLTARSTEDDMLRGLDIGADDYLSKPFSPRELVARVRAVLRRVADDWASGPVEVQVGELSAHFARHEVYLAGVQVHLTPKEFRLLQTLAEEPGRVYSRLELLDKVFGGDYEGLERTVDVHVLNLRKKIERNPAQPRYVLTVFGAGYKLATEYEHA